MANNTPPITGIIYKTTNLINGKWYIGKDEKNNPNYLGSGKLLLRAIAKYGKNNFNKEILAESLSSNELAKLEKLFIEKTNAVQDKNSYNIADGGYGGNTLAGFSNNERQLFGEKMKEILVSLPEDKKMKRAEKISKALKGKPKTEDHKNKISESKTGIKQSPETIDKKRVISKKLYDEGIISLPKGTWKGKVHTDESKLKMSAAKTGVKNKNNRLFSISEHQEIQVLYKNGVKTSIIAKMFSTSGPTILRYVRETILI